ncbi:hypothetical protein UT300003_32370 [Clostridium sardiniense]
MRARELRERLTVGDIFNVMEKLGADHLPDAGGNEVMFRTICHCGDSHKLYFFKDTKMFHCYTNCGQMDIINIAENVLGVSFIEAKEYIQKVIGVYDGFDMNIGFNEYDPSEDVESDLELLRRNECYKKPIDLTRKYTILDSNILNTFRKMYHPSFYNDGISLNTLCKFGIRYDILNFRIIIPHWDEHGNLIAIRCRNLSEELIEQGMKYTPIYFNGKPLSAPTRMYFYGLNFNIENIKKIKKVILVESEKAVMQIDTMLNGEGFALALSSSSLHLIQVEILKGLGIEEVIIGLDKEFSEYGSKEEKLYAMKIRKSLINKLLPYFNVSVMWDQNNLLKIKESPTDRGVEIFTKLYNNRIQIKE